MEFKEGDVIIYNTINMGTDNTHSPLWEGICGKIKGTVITINDKKYKEKFSRPDPDYPLKIAWGNGEVNGYSTFWFPSFKVVDKKSTQLSLFKGETI